MEEKTIKIPLKRISYEDILSLNIDLQTKLFVAEKKLQDKEKYIETLQYDLDRENSKTRELSKRILKVKDIVEGYTTLNPLRIRNKIIDILLGKDKEEKGE